jgi:hypothetical protein
MTGRDLISASLRLIGAIAPGETPSATEATDGLASLNRMLDSWSNEGLMIYTLTKEASIPLTPAKNAYTLGASGDLTSRPMEIERATIQDAASGVEYPINPLTASEWAGIQLKTNQSNYPYAMFDDGGYPQRTIYLYPTPSAANKLNLYTLRPLTTISTLDTVLSFPPGFERALVFNGAIELSAEYGGAPPSDMVMMNASEAKNSIKRSNFRQSHLRCDSAIRSAGKFNIETGDYNR